MTEVTMHRDTKGNLHETYDQMVAAEHKYVCQIAETKLVKAFESVGDIRGIISPNTDDTSMYEQTRHAQMRYGDATATLCTKPQAVIDILQQYIRETRK